MLTEDIRQKHIGWTIKAVKLFSKGSWIKTFFSHKNKYQLCTNSKKFSKSIILVQWMNRRQLVFLTWTSRNGVISWRILWMALGCSDADGISRVRPIIVPRWWTYCRRILTITWSELGISWKHFPQTIPGMCWLKLAIVRNPLEDSLQGWKSDPFLKIAVLYKSL